VEYIKSVRPLRYEHLRTTLFQASLGGTTWQSLTVQSSLLVVNLSRAAAHCRGGLVLLSSPQKDQKGKSVEMLLCRTRPYPANQAKPGLLYFYAAVATHFGLYPSVKICYALPLHTRPPSFCLISPEAVLLTGEKKKASSSFMLLLSGKSGVATSSLAY